MSIAAQLARAHENLAELSRKLERAERRESQARDDSLQRANEARQLTSREHLMTVQATARAYQARCDEAVASWGLRAPAPVAGAPLDAYRRDLLILAKKQLPESDELRSVQVRQLAADALPVFEDRIYDACKSAAYRGDTVPEGQLRKIVERDANGLQVTKFVGQHSFVRDFTIPGRRVRIRDFTEFAR
jgi:hypothetical protein